jgi:cell division protein FtsW (lipid II flippase)
MKNDIRKIITRTFFILGILLFLIAIYIWIDYSFGDFLYYIFIGLICMLIAVIAIKPEDEDEKEIGEEKQNERRN